MSMDRYWSTQPCNHSTNWEGPFVATLDAHFDSNRSLRIFINKDIAEVIIDNLVFHPDDVEGISQSRVLARFKPFQVEEDKPNPDQWHVENYVALIYLKKHNNLIYVFATSLAVPPFEWHLGWCKLLWKNWDSAIFVVAMIKLHPITLGWFVLPRCRKSQEALEAVWSILNCCRLLNTSIGILSRHSMVPSEWHDL